MCRGGVVFLKGTLGHLPRGQWDPTLGQLFDDGSLPDREPGHLLLVVGGKGLREFVQSHVEVVQSAIARSATARQKEALNRATAVNLDRRHATVQG